MRAGADRGPGAGGTADQQHHGVPDLGAGPARLTITYPAAAGPDQTVTLDVAGADAAALPGF